MYVSIYVCMYVYVSDNKNLGKKTERAPTCSTLKQIRANFKIGTWPILNK